MCIVVCMCVSARARVCVRVCVCVGGGGGACVRDSVRACVRVVCMRAISFLKVSPSR